MRYFSFFLLIIVFYSQSQSVSFDYILSGEIQKIDSFSLKKLQDPTITQVKMPFGKATISEPQLVEKLKNHKISAIDLVFTKYKTSHNFDQTSLNYKRLETLYKYLPAIFNNTLIKWNLIEQQSGNSREEAKKLFHGFIIHSVPVNSTNTALIKLSIAAEINEIEEALKTYTYTPPKKDSLLVCNEDKVTRDTLTGKYNAKSIKKRDKGITYTNKSIWNRSPEIKVYTEVVKTCDTNRFVRPGYYGYKHDFSDSVVFKTLSNLSQKSLENAVLVEDVTGSMSPFISQTIMWFKLNPLKINRYVFFNDGDSLPDYKKKLGKTGGIYYLKVNDTSELKPFIFEVMRNGHGGDIPENNIEAILTAIDQFQGADTIYMIADNYAPVKDLSLLNNVSKPVSIMLCGAKKDIMSDYLTIVHQTGGILYTDEGIVSIPENLEENDIITIRGQRFQFRGNRFILRR